MKIKIARSYNYVSCCRINGELDLELKRKKKKEKPLELGLLYSTWHADRGGTISYDTLLGGTT